MPTIQELTTADRRTARVAHATFIGDKSRWKGSSEADGCIFTSRKGQETGNAVFKREGAVIVAEAETARIIGRNYEYELEWRGLDPAQAGEHVIPDVTFRDRMTIRVGGREVIFFHTPAAAGEGCIEDNGVYGRCGAEPWGYDCVVPAIQALPCMYREVLLLRDVEHLSNEEAALVLGITVSATKTRLLRARLMMREYLAPHFAKPWHHRLLGRFTQPRRHV